jgi:hypothetical protein
MRCSIPDVKDTSSTLMMVSEGNYRPFRGNLTPKEHKKGLRNMLRKRKKW